MVKVLGTCLDKELQPEKKGSLEDVIFTGGNWY
jgi:hypothetical protein